MQTQTRNRARHRRTIEPIDTASIRVERNGDKPPKSDSVKLIQLCASVIILLSILLVKNFFPNGAVIIQEKIVGNIENGVDYKEVFGAIGKAVGNGDDVSAVFKNIYVEFFERDKSKQNVSEDMPEENKQTDTVVNSDEPPEEISDLPGEDAIVAPGLIDGEKEEIAAAADRAMSLRSAALTSRGLSDGIYSILPRTQTNGYVWEYEKLSGDEPPVPEVVRVGYVKIDMRVTVPLKGTIWSKFGFRDHPIDGEYKFHYGIDIGGSIGANIVSFADGEVYEVGQNYTYGNYVRIMHKEGISTFYAHCSKIYVKEGQKVKLGEKVAAVGQSGQATGPHLHFEVRKDGKIIDPAYYL